MSHTDIISIIIPNYNNEKYLSQCLESILQQSYKNIEIVIIDDASTDNSIEILKEYEKKYSFIKVIYNKKNQGVTKNRDSAIKIATGEYITTLDSDDYFIDNKKLEKELETIRKFKNQGKNNIIAFSNIVLVDAQSKRLFPNAKNNIAEGNILIEIFTRSCMVPRDFIFTKEQYIVAGGFDLDIPIYEDWDLKLRLSAHNKFYYTGLDGIAYRRHGEGLSSANANKHKKWLKYIYRKNINLVTKEKQNHVEQNFNAYLNKAFNTSIYNVFKEKFKSLLQRLTK